MKKVVVTSNAPQAIGPYSQAILVNNVLYTSGQIAIDPSTGSIVEGGIEKQTRQVLDNIGAILKEAGCSYKDVVKTTVFITDMNSFQVVNAVYAEYFAEESPARSCVEVAALPKNAMIEIEVVAVK